MAASCPTWSRARLFNAMNCHLRYSMPENTTVSQLTISGFLCPSEVKPQPRTDATTGEVVHGVNNYGWNHGRLVRLGRVSPTLRTAPRSISTIARRFAAFTDGLSNTLFAAEVKTYQSSLSNCGSGLANVIDPSNSPADARPTRSRSPPVHLGLYARADRPHRMGGRGGPRDGLHDRLDAQQADLPHRGPPQSWTSINSSNAVLSYGGPSFARHHLAQLPSRRRQRPVRRRLGEVHQGRHQRRRVAVARDHGGRRGHLVGPALTSRGPYSGGATIKGQGPRDQSVGF